MERELSTSEKIEQHQKDWRRLLREIEAKGEEAGRMAELISELQELHRLENMTDLELFEHDLLR